MLSFFLQIWQTNVTYIFKSTYTINCYDSYILSVIQTWKSELSKNDYIPRNTHHQPARHSLHTPTLFPFCLQSTVAVKAFIYGQEVSSVWVHSSTHRCWLFRFRAIFYLLQCLLFTIEVIVYSKLSCVNNITRQVTALQTKWRYSKLSGSYVNTYSNCIWLLFFLFSQICIAIVTYFQFYWRLLKI